VLLAAVVVFIATVVFYTNGASLTVFIVLLTDGLTAFGWVLGAAALGAVVLRVLRIECNRLLFVATAGGLGLGIFSLLGLGLGLAGWLNRGVALAMPTVGVILFVVDWLRRQTSLKHEVDLSGIRRWLLLPAGISWLWLVPVVSLATAAVAASVMPGDLWKPLDPHPYDVLSYHLQVPREWYEAGRIEPLSHNVFSYFPFNVEMQFLLAMEATGGPWNGMYVCQFISLAYAVLMVLAVAGCEGEGSTSNEETGSEAVIGAAVASTVPWVIMLESMAYVESGLMLYTALALGWVMWALGVRRRSRSAPCCANREPSGSAAGVAEFTEPSRAAWKDFILAGIMAGLACGVKITAVPMLLLAVPAALGVMGAARGIVWIIKKRLASPDLAAARRAGGSSSAAQEPPALRTAAKWDDAKRGAMQWLAPCAIFVVAGSLVLSPWLLRNVAWCGNPVFPVAMETLGHGHFTEVQVERFHIAHSPRPDQRALASRLRIAWNEVPANWQYGYVLLPMGLLVAAWRWRDRRTWLLLLTGAIIFIVWIGFTHLEPRFLVMLIPLAAMLIAPVRWGRAWPMGVMIVLVAAGFGWTGVFGRLAQTTRDPVRSAFIGVQDLSFLVPPELTDPINVDKQVGLVGGAEAFLYQIPMTRLHYRTVFDIPAGDGNPIDAWVGSAARGNPNWLLVINPAEVQRLHQTYWKVPGPSKDWASKVPFVMPGEAMGR
jgi:hypothetical protein